MLTLHHAPNSHAGRIVWLLKELQLPYEPNRMEFHPRALKSDGHRARRSVFSSAKQSLGAIRSPVDHAFAWSRALSKGSPIVSASPTIDPEPNVLVFWG